MEGLYAVANCMRVRSEKVGGHCLERLKGVPILLRHIATPVESTLAENSGVISCGGSDLVKLDLLCIHHSARPCTALSGCGTWFSMSTAVSLFGGVSSQGTHRVVWRRIQEPAGCLRREVQHLRPVIFAAIVYLLSKYLERTTTVHQSTLDARHTTPLGISRSAHRHL